MATNRIAELRKRARLSVSELARRAGTSGPQITRLENGKRKLTHQWMEKIARALGVSTTELISNSTMEPLVDEVEPAALKGFDGVAAAIASRGLHVYRVVGASVERAGFASGQFIAVDQSEAAVANIKLGDVVLVSAPNPGARLLRQFVAPRMVITNRDGNNIAMDLSEDLKVIGVVIPPKVDAVG